MYSSCFRGVRPRRRPASSCCDSLLHILVFIFFSMNTPLHTEGHRWRVTRTLDTGAVQQDIYRSSCKITNKPVSLHVLFVLTNFLFHLFLYVSPTVLYLYLQLCINCSHLLSSLFTLTIYFHYLLCVYAPCCKYCKCLRYTYVYTYVFRSKIISPIQVVWN